MKTRPKGERSRCQSRVRCRGKWNSKYESRNKFKYSIQDDSECINDTELWSDPSHCSKSVLAVSLSVLACKCYVLKSPQVTVLSNDITHKKNT